MSKADLLVVAGEASGDLHAARLLEELQRLEKGGLRPFGLGGDELHALGLDAVAHSSEVAVVGITEAIRVLPSARRIYRRLLEEVERRRPEVAVLVDFAEFNMRLAGELHRRRVKVVYYVSPQVWAWRVGRVRKIARTVDRMLVLFPFEEAFYRERGVEVVHVGHPLTDEVPRLEQVWDRRPAAGGPFTIALLPGSRPSEVERLLPILLRAAEQIAARLEARFRLIRAPNLPAERFSAALAAASVPVELVDRERAAALAGSHLALCASGTATLETALLGTPLLVVYKVSVWSYLAGLLLVRLPYVSLVNLVLGREAVPELLQGEATAARVASEAVRLLRSPDSVQRMRAELAELRRVLGRGGASARAAAQVRQVLHS